MVSPSISESEKQDICDEVKKIKSDLQVYKDAHVRFFKSSINSWVHPVLSGMGMDVEEIEDIKRPTAKSSEPWVIEL